MTKFKSIPTNDVEIRINARSAGDYGVIRIGGIEREPKEEYRKCEEILRDIKRHVDDIGWTHIQQKNVYETEDGEQHDTLYDVLQHLYDEEGGVLPEYIYRYERPSDRGVGTGGHKNDFREIIEEAWHNPWNFTVKGTSLTADQRKFLDRVIASSLEEKMPKAIESTESA